MSIYQVQIESISAPVILPAVASMPHAVQVSMDADMLCAALAQAFAQELSVAYIEAFLAEVRARRQEGIDTDAVESARC
jgi:hypothetical protein